MSCLTDCMLSFQRVELSSINSVSIIKCMAVTANVLVFFALCTQSSCTSNGSTGLLFSKNKQLFFDHLAEAHTISSYLRRTQRSGVVRGSRSHNGAESSQFSIISTPSHFFPPEDSCPDVLPLLLLILPDCGAQYFQTSVIGWLTLTRSREHTPRTLGARVWQHFELRFITANTFNAFKKERSARCFCFFWPFEFNFFSICSPSAPCSSGS